MSNQQGGVEDSPLLAAHNRDVRDIRLAQAARETRADQAQFGADASSLHSQAERHRLETADRREQVARLLGTGIIRTGERTVVVFAPGGEVRTTSRDELQQRIVGGQTLHSYAQQGFGLVDVDHVRSVAPHTIGLPPDAQNTPGVG